LRNVTLLKCKPRGRPKKLKKRAPENLDLNKDGTRYRYSIETITLAKKHPTSRLKRKRQDLHDDEIESFIADIVIVFKKNKVYDESDLKIENWSRKLISFYEKFKISSYFSSFFSSDAILFLENIYINSKKNYLR
jgi:hypothetical protein